MKKVGFCLCKMRWDTIYSIMYKYAGKGRCVMKKKIQSDSGASIVFALLIFLLCGVVASVVLAAATAAAGRVGGTAEMDSRYYSVTSAAELFREALDREGAVTIVRTQTTRTTVKTTYTNTEEGAVLTDGPATSVFTDFSLHLNGGVLTPSSDSDTTLLQKLALFMVFGVDGGIDDAVLSSTWQNEVFDPAVERSFGLKLEFESGELEADTLAALAVDVSGVLRKDGTLELTFSNAEGTDKYAVVMVFAADVEQSSVDEVYEDAPVIDRDEENNSFTESVTVTAEERKTASIRWVMIDMRKVVSSHEGT